MSKVLLVVTMLLMVASAGFCQRDVTSVTDYLNVPTAKVLPVGTVFVGVQATANDVWNKDNNLGFLVDVGVSERLGVSLTASEDLNKKDLVAGVKFIAGEKDQLVGPGSQVALFLYNIGEARTAVPGATLTVDCEKVEWLSWTTAGWYADSNWEYGGGVTATLNENLNLQAEYSSVDKFVYGAALSYKNLYGEVRYLDEAEEFYGVAGVKLNVW